LFKNQSGRAFFPVFRPRQILGKARFPLIILTFFRFAGLKKTDMMLK